MFRTIILAACLINLLFSNLYSQNQPKKMALIVGISKYKQFAEGNNWNTIHGADDIKYIKAALINQGFKPADIDTLKDEQATKVGMVKALRRLRDRAEKDAIVVFHFSGHGQQICDNYKLDEWDGLDEALVPFDARKVKDRITDTGQFHFRDDELGDMLMDIRKKIGNNGSLLVLLDACYSGTGTRGETTSVPRGTTITFESKDCAREMHEGPPPHNRELLDDTVLISNMIVISPVSADELNYEVKDPNYNKPEFLIGPLTLAFTKAITQTKNEINYEILFEKIKNDIQAWKSIQTPMIEGDLNQKVLGGSYIPLGEFARVNWKNDTTVEIPRGVLHNVFEGTEFRLFPLEAIDLTAGSELATGKIASTTVTTSEGILNKQIKFKAGELYKVIIDTKNFGEITVTLNIKLPEALTKQLSSELSKANYVTLVKANSDLAVLIADIKGKKELQLVTEEKNVLWKEDWPDVGKSRLSEIELDTIQKGIKNHAVAQFLRKVAIPDDEKFSGVKVTFTGVTFKKREIPINGECDLEVIDTFPLQVKENRKKELELLETNKNISINESIRIEVKNGGDKEVYLSVLDITPLDGVSVMIPGTERADNYKIPAGKSLTTCPIELSKPYGREHFKVLISGKELSLYGIQQKAITRGKLTTSFEHFYNQSLFGDESAAKRWKTPSVNSGEIKIIPFVFNIVERK